MDKKKLVEVIRQKLEADMVVLRQAALATYEAATHEESKPENEYDTRGLEASYLAGAQAKRIAEIEELLVIYKHINLKNFGPDDKINATAIVEVEFNGKASYFFIMPKGGGVSVPFEGKTIQVITAATPLGEALQDLREGDAAIVETNGQTREYEIVKVW